VAQHIYWNNTESQTVKILTISASAFTLRHISQQSHTHFGVCSVIDGALYSRLVFSVGRKGSSDVAGWWSVRVQPDQNTFGSYPGELNFAFGGKLYFTIFIDGASDTLVVNDIFMAQGHSGSSNNWWIGGPKCQRTGSVIKCEARDKNGSGRLWYVLMERGNNTSVDVVSVRDMILVG
jgi:hypothetical protein